MARRVTRAQLWRPITSACFLGPLSMSYATSLFFLINYGQELERNKGSANFAVFMMTQLVVLSVLGLTLGLPQIAQSMISATIYCCSRQNPFAEIQWQFGLQLKYWMLPFGLMAVEVLQGQAQMSAAIPHMLGILSGHFYHFFTEVWPRVSGSRSGAWFEAPSALRSRLDDGIRRHTASQAKPAKSVRRKLGS